MRKKLVKILVLILILFVLLPTVIVVLIGIGNNNKIYTDTTEVPESYAALVLGAGVWEDGEPSAILEDRVIKAVELYKKGKVKKIIMSGDNRFIDYNEPEAMIKLATELGVPEEDLQPDYAGRRTYDSCLRVKNIFNQNQIIVVTQSFHIDRAVYICNSLGIETYGVISDRQEYVDSQWFYWSLRDKFATFLAFIDVNIIHPDVVGGEKIQI